MKDIDPREPGGRSFVSWPVSRAIAVVAAVVVLWSLSTVLAGEYHTRKAGRALRAAELGRAELSNRAADSAIGHFRNAVALDPDRIPYRLDLAKALLAVGQTGEATSYLRDVLNKDPVNGGANLALARIHDALGDEQNAETAFYRAIYGRWAPEEQQTRLEARLELIGFLRRTADRDRVRAELSQLAVAFPGDLALQMLAGRSLLEMGFPDEAAYAFRAASTRLADPGGTLAGLAEAELIRGDYASALAAARLAVQRDPVDLESASRRDLATTLLAMDPTQPRLSVRERTRRTAMLLARLRPLLEACQDAGGLADAKSLQESIVAWLDAPRAGQVERIDEGLAKLEAAAQVLTTCQDRRSDEALELLVQRIASTSRP